MAASRSSFLALFDEFSDVNSRKINLFLDFAKRRISEKAWGDCAEEACYYLTAHLIASTGGEGGVGGAVAGPVTSETVGSLSRSYGQVQVNSNGNDELFTTTSYGRMFLNLRRECVVSGMVLCASKPGHHHGEY